MGVIVVGIAVAAVLYLWLGSYAPLRTLDTAYAPGPGIGTDVEPVPGSGGRPVFFPTAGRKRFDTAFTLRNSGRFPVTVTGLSKSTPGPAPWLGPEELLATTSSIPSADPGDLLPFGTLRIDAGDTATVVVRFALHCKGATAGAPDVYVDAVRLRYRYLSLFTRTQTVRLPFAVTLRCFGGPPAIP
jgi:hypothetical protein